MWCCAAIKLGETDRIVTILAQGHGKVRGVAKGVRKPGSRFGARLEPTTHIAFQCYRGRSDLDIVTQVETIDANRALREHYGCLTHAVSMLEAADQVAQDREANPALYRMLVGALRTLADTPTPARERRRSSGSCCRSRGSTPCSTPACAAATRTGPFPAFDLAEGGVLCATCGRVDGRRLPPETLDLVRRILGGDLRGALGGAAERHHHRRRTARGRDPRAPLRPSAAQRRACSEPARSGRNPFGRRKGSRLRSYCLMAKADQMDRIVNLAKRRGLVFPSSEIYGGFRSTWDYGPLGVLLKRNVKDAWWRSMVQLRDDVVGLDAAILMAPKVWEASGHLATFTDPLVDCRNCKERFRADQLPESGACPNCGAKDSFTEARNFNLMFKTYVGPVEDDASVAYLRPETAQGIFVNFANVQTTTPQEAAVRHRADRQVVPQRDHARQLHLPHARVRADGDGVLRAARRRRAAGTSTGAQERYRWYIDLGIPEATLRLRPHDPDELSHYSVGTSDVEFEYPWGWGELEGIANRTDFDLTQHAKFSGQDLSYFDQENDRRYVPYVIEPAAGADRATLAFLLAAYDEQEVENGKGGTETRTVLHLHPRLAPIKVAVLPLSKNEKLVPVADEVAGLLRERLMIDVDVAGSIGRRYRRQDEVGTPLCVTIDFDTLDDKAVTIRDRDTMAQERVPVADLRAELEHRLGF